MLCIYNHNEINGKAALEFEGTLLMALHILYISFGPFVQFHLIHNVTLGKNQFWPPLPMLSVMDNCKPQSDWRSFCCCWWCFLYVYCSFIWSRPV